MKYIFYSIITIGIIVLVITPFSVDATAGLPGSAKFGYGAHIDIDGTHLDESISTAASIGLDWVAVEFNWESMWADPNSPPNITLLSDVINKSNQLGLSVLLSIVNPPKWAITESGPDPQTTANLVLSLIDFYANKVFAVELFPGANTIDGWRVIPNPKSYLFALNKVQETLKIAGKNIAVVTTLTPASINPSPYDVNDLEFLNQLYQSGGKSNLTIIGVKLNNLIGDPYSNPKLNTLRHYEEIRAVMLNNGHDFGTIWITGFGWPDEDTKYFETSSAQSKSVVEQKNSKWLEEAFDLMKAQLYIGAAFFDQINPQGNMNQNDTKVTLISRESQIHPAANQLKLLIDQQKSRTQIPITGTSNRSTAIKSLDSYQTYLSILIKKYVKHTDFKQP